MFFFDPFIKNDGSKRLIIDNDFDNSYCLQNAKEVLDNKIGLCFRTDKESINNDDIYNSIFSITNNLNIEVDDIGIKESNSNIVLPCGNFARWEYF